MDYKCIESRIICECHNGRKSTYDALILGVTEYGVNFVPISYHRMYSEIPSAKISSFDGNWYICFDRVMFLSKGDFHKIFIESYRKLTFSEFNKLSYTIHQFYMGDIVWNKYSNTFIYRDEYKEIKDGIRRKQMDITITGKKYEQCIYKDHPVDIGPIDTSETNPTDFTAMEHIDNEIYDDIEVDLEMDFTDSDMAEIVKMAKSFNVPTKKRTDTSGNEYLVFNLVKYKGPKYKYGKSSSKPRVTDPDKHVQFKRAWFTYEEVVIIARMNSASVASEYECSVHIATEMIRNAKHILSIYVASRTVKRNFACYFDKGYGIEDVHEIYPDLTLSTIESQYVQWTLNANSPNNTNVRERWKNIIENNDIRTMGEYVFLTTNVFAEREDCSPSAASDILHKIFDRLSINPLLCAGFESEIFEPEALANTIMDIDNSYNRTMEEKILLERYNIVSRLNKAYRDSYNDHYNIKAGKKNIPESVDESDRDYFMSLIWNRFSRHQVMRNRTLSFNQSYAIKSGDAFKVALYFMVPYKTAVGIISRYKNKV